MQSSSLFFSPRRFLGSGVLLRIQKESLRGNYGPPCHWLSGPVFFSRPLPKSEGVGLYLEGGLHKLNV